MSADYDAIVWDWNGTLLDDVGLAIATMNRMLASRGKPEIDLAVYVEVFDFPVRDYYERVGFDLQQHDFGGLSDEFCSAFEAGLAQAELFEGVSDTLHALASLQHFVLSNTESGALERMLHKFELQHRFKGVFGLPDNHAGGKTAIGRRMLEEHALAERRTLLIGDTTHDAEVAQELQIDCLLVATGHNSERRLSGMGVPVVRSLGDVAAYVNGN